MNMIQRMECRQAFARMAVKRGLQSKATTEYGKRILAIYERVWERHYQKQK